MNLTREFISKIPKSDLHLHLDGSLRINTLIDLAKENGVDLPSYTEDGLKEKVFKEKYNDLGEYLHGFAYTCAVLQDKESLERVAYELAVDNMMEGVRYIEVRFAPQLHITDNLNFVQVVTAVNKGLKRATDDFNAKEDVVKKNEPEFRYGLILCAMRMFDYGFSRYFDKILDVHSYSEKKWIFSLASQELVKAAIDLKSKEDIAIVGFDLAGMEYGYPAEDHNPAYSLAHKNFIKKTVHAGEAYGPESIFQAITDLHADRIGHGVHLFDHNMISDSSISDKEEYVENLAEYISDRRVTLEICLTSNLQTNPDIRELKEHPFGKMRDKRISMTLCTDNRTVSRTTVTDEVFKAVETFNLNQKELKDIIIYGFKRSFYHGSYLSKRKYVRSIIDYYEKIEKSFIKK